jgi:cytochrome c peroxidase
VIPWLFLLLAVDNSELGRALFSDTRLSRDGSISCATCHDPHRAFTDGRARAEGIGGARGERNTPTLINRGDGATQFWDGRAATLEEQVLEPIANPKEMGSSVDEAAARVGHSPAEIAAALAGYVRSIRAGGSIYDRMLKGSAAFTDEQWRGIELFNGKANCHACHSGSNLTDEAFHNTGVAWGDERIRDEGRFAITGKPYHHGAFKTPTLREIEHTAPYMHDGSLATLEDVVDYYDRGGNANPHLDPDIRPLHLNAGEKRALAAFLRTLSGTVREGR